MKDSKQVRSEYQSFVESYSSIAAKGAEEAKKAEMKKKPSKKGEEECTCEMVLMRKSGAFTELAERYQMSVKQFARFVEANQGLFDIETRKKAILANKFSGFKESVEWDEFFGDVELVEVQEGLGLVTGTAKAINAVMKRRDQTPAQEKKAVGDLTRAMDVVAKPIKSATKAVLSVGPEKNKEMMNKRRPTPAQAQRMEEVEGEELLEVTTKETAAGTKYKVRVKEKESGSSYIRYATREKIAQLRADPKIASVEMTDEGDAPEDKGEKKAQEKGGGLAVKAKKKREKEAKEREAAAKPAKPAKRSVTTEGMDPVGQEDADIDNDGDTDKSDKYLHNRRKAIGKAMKKRGTKKESFSNWRDELRETMGGDKVPTKLQKEKKPTGPVKNKVVINPPMGEDFDPQKVAEALGAELVDCEEQVKPEFQGQSGFDRLMRPIVDKKSPVRQGSPDKPKTASTPSPGTATVQNPDAKGDPSPGSARYPNKSSTPDIGSARYPNKSSTPDIGSARNPRKPRNEAVSTGPILPGEGGKRIYPKGQEPKPTGAKLPPVQKAGFEPEGDQLDEFLFGGPKTVTPKPGESPSNTKSVEVNKPYPARLNGRRVMKVYDKAGGSTTRPFSSAEKAMYDRKYGHGQIKKIDWSNLESFEPDGEQIDEIAPALAIGAATGIAAGGAALINKLRQQKKDMDAGKKVGGPMGAIQRRNEMLRKAGGQ